jgi:hypothetical protein
MERGVFESKGGEVYMYWLGWAYGYMDSVGLWKGWSFNVVTRL